MEAITHLERETFVAAAVAKNALNEAAGVTCGLLRRSLSLEQKHIARLARRLLLSSPWFPIIVLLASKVNTKESRSIISLSHL
jgi:hypothetical protein